VFPRETIDVLETHRFDVGALDRYLRAHIKDFAGIAVVRQFRGGQSNPTYYLETELAPSGADLDSSGADLLGPRQLVLRRKPPGQLLPSAHAIERE